MILMMVICTIIFALSLSARMTELGVETQRLMDHTRNRENNYLMARSALEMGLNLLKNDDGKTDNLQDFWAQGEVTMQWEGRPVSLRIVDEESKFPLSAMQQNPDDCEYLQEALKRFAENAGLREGPTLVDQFLDWTDPDGIRRARGAEESDYTDRRKFKDGPCHSIYEVMALPAWSSWPHFPSPRISANLANVGLASSSGETANSEQKNAPKSETTGNFAHDGTGKSRFSGGSFNNDVPETQSTGNSDTSSWEEWMSVNSSGKVNINTAPIQILRCLDEKMSETLVAEIDSMRRSSAFEDINDLRNVTGFDEDLRHRLSKYICVKSKVFEVRAVVFSNPGTITVKAIVDRSGDAVTVKRWEVK